MEAYITPIVGIFAIISGAYGALIMVKKWFTEPIREIKEIMAMIEIKIDINNEYQKEHSGNGYSEFYDKALERKIKEKDLQKLIKEK